MIFLLLATIFSILYHGYYFGRVDQPLYISFIKKFLDSSVFPNDAFMDMWYANFPIFMWKGIAVLSQLISLELLLFLLFIISRFLLFLAIYKLAIYIFRKKVIGYLAVLFWFIPQPALGYDIFYNNFVQSQAALPIILFASYFFLKQKYLLAYVLLAVNAYIHPHLTLYTGIIFNLILLIDKRFVELFKYNIFVILLTIPIMLNGISVFQNSGIFDNEWLEIIRIRNAHHSFPFSWGFEHWMPFLSISFLSFVSFFSLKKIIKKDLIKKIVYFLFVPLAVIIAGVVFSEIIPLPSIILLLPFHVSSIFVVFGSILIAGFLYKLIKRKSFVFQSVGHILAYLFFFSQYISPFSRSFIIFLPVYIVMFFLFRNSPKILFALVVVLITFIWLPYMGYKNASVNDSKYNDWVNLQEWTRENTSPHDTFITPIYLNGFRLYSERSIVASWKDGTGGLLSPTYMKQWWQRMKDFGLQKNYYDLYYQKKVYKNLTEDQIYKISKKYQAEHFVTEKNSQYSFEKIYSNNSFVIYKLDFAR